MPTEKTEEFIDLFGLISHVWSRKKVVLICCLFGLVAGVLYGMLRSPVYEAQAVISSNAPKSALSEVVGGAFPVGGSGGAALLEVRLKTRSISEKVAELEPEVATVLFAKRWDDRSGTWKSGSAPSPVAIGSRLRFKHLELTANTRSGIVEIKVSLPDSTYVKKIADAYLVALKLSIQENISKDLEESIRFLQQQAANASDPLIYSRIQELSARNVEQAFLNNPADFQVVEYPSYPTGKSGFGVAKLAVVSAFLVTLLSVFFLAGQYILLAMMSERNGRRRP